MSLSILHEDNNILVIDKPAGLMVHGDGHSCVRSLADILLEENKVGRDIGEPLVIKVNKGTVAGCTEISHVYGEGTLTMYRPGIVHRLDRETSGVMVIAKTQEMFLFLKEAFQVRAVKKEYLALVRGGFKENLGSVTLPIGRAKHDFRKWRARPGTRGELRDATTDYRVEGTYRDDTGTDWSVVSIFPKTGRTHQIRVHMADTNHPVAGDMLYGEEKESHFPRLMLHARRLTIPTMDGGKLTLTAEIPEAFNDVFEIAQISLA